MHSAFQMINVGAKPITYRIAVACGEIVVGMQAFGLIRDRKLPKGDVLVLAEIAGIQGAKKAYEMIPLCHPMGLDSVKVFTELDQDSMSVRVYCVASVHAKTGIEMEVLAGVNAALLTIWDLTKMIESDLVIRNVKLLAKKGGKSGLWLNPAGAPAWVTELVGDQTIHNVLKGRKVAVVTLSDRAARGEYADISGETLKALLEEAGGTICDYRVIADDKEGIESTVNQIIHTHQPHLLITTGGTGVSLRDNTPDVVQSMLDKVIPGVGELLRQDGAYHTPLSWSSRAVGGIIGNTVVVTLPGSPAAVKEGVAALLPKLLPHLIRITRGES